MPEIGIDSAAASFYTKACIATMEGSVSRVRWSIDKWQSLFRTLFRPEHVAFFPHKVFRWDAQGIYLDCFFPFPCEHLLGGEAVLGKSVKEVLPKPVGLTIQRAVGLTLRRGHPQDVQCVLPAGKKSYVASVRLFPYDSEVLGFVTDHDLNGKPVIWLTPDHPSMEFLKGPPGILPKIASLSPKDISKSHS